MTNQEYQENVLKLMQKKDKIEDEIKNLTAILTKNGVGMSDPLVDKQGFPLNHVDIYQVRHARQKIICLQNDHKNVMKEIEAGLQGYYSSSVGNANTNMNSNTVNTSTIRNPTVFKDPFAKITIVTEGSPAAYAGLQVDDLIVEFGSLNALNFTNVVDIGNVAKHSEGHQLPVKLKRGDRYIVVQLVPKRWVGRGLLGCNIVGLS